MKKKSLYQEFKYYKNRYKNYLIGEQAFEEAQGGFTFSSGLPNIFQKLDYTELFDKGISRRYGKKIYFYKGEEAVKEVIKSLKNQSSLSWRKKQFADNYTNAMFKIGMDLKFIQWTHKNLMKMSTSRLRFIIAKNYLPSIQFIYSEESTENEYVQRIKYALIADFKEDVSKIEQNAKKIMPLIRERVKITENQWK